MWVYYSICYATYTNRVIKLTSPNLSYAIILGVALTLIGNLLMTDFQSRNTELISTLCIVSKYSICVHLNMKLYIQIKRMSATLGYDICFVVALVKTGRVVYIFRKASPNKKGCDLIMNWYWHSLINTCSLQKVKDWHLLFLSAGIVMIEVVYVVPLLMLIYVMGDARFETDYENPSFINARKLILLYDWPLERVIYIICVCRKCQGNWAQWAG